MMITHTNYAQSTKGITVPARLKEGHSYVLENADLYDHDSDIKELIDMHVKEMNKIGANSGNIKQEPHHLFQINDARRDEQRSNNNNEPVFYTTKEYNEHMAKEATVAKKISKAKKVVSKKFMKPAPLPSKAEVTPDVSIIKKWMSFHKKTKTKNALLAFIKTMQKSVADKNIRATSKFADILKEIQAAATVQYNGLSASESIRIEFKPSTLKKYSDIIGNLSPYKSLALIKRFIGIQGSTDTLKINRLAFAFKKTKLATDDPYKSEITRIGKLLTGSKIAISKQELAGLEGILGCACEHVNEDLGFLPYDTEPIGLAKEKPLFNYAKHNASVNESNSLFVKASDRSAAKKASNTFRLNGELGEFMGDLQAYKLAIAVSGDTHAGKTQVVMQLADAFLDIGKKVGMFDLEQGGTQSKDTQAAIDQWVNPKYVDKLLVAAEAPKGIDTIREYANQFDVLFIDSWQKLNLPNTAFDRLRNEFPNTIFVVIFQQNAEGTTRGGNSSDYDANIQIKVVNVDDTKQNNYALMKKNRGNKVGLKYNWSKKKLID